ncbi:AI-2E family transporter [Proteiniborus sp. MB09-C3]|uniref:AI-2E family transporter n=1 Tax=Proteiniborus sp. MB09-C3 TaxID=3050072 RepID=UPI00255518E7|nr:AI-2E family transporter [Proteiniborus sp. MB09-C3]WIV13349.1 AI-2E family transporter [Proteiniborus sp. MB09-C3]
MDSKKYVFHLINISLVLLIILLFSRLSGFFSPLVNALRIFITPIIISIFLYYVLRPIIRKLENKKVNKGLLIITIILIFIFLLTVLIINGGAVLKEQFENSFLASLDKNIDLKGLLNDNIGILLPENFDITDKIISEAKEILLKLSANISGIFLQIGDIGTQIILVPFLLFYLLKDDRVFSKKFLSIMPKTHKKHIIATLSNLDDILSTYISGQIMVTFIIGSLMFVGYLIIGLPNALLMGLFAMVTSIIPFIGTFLGILPALFIGLTIDLAMIFKIIIVAVLVQQIEGNLITPNIMKSKLNIHPLLVMIIVIASVNLLGILGAFIGVPLYLIINTLVKTIYGISKERKIASNISKANN